MSFVKSFDFVCLEFVSGDFVCLEFVSGDFVCLEFVSSLCLHVVLFGVCFW